MNNPTKDGYTFLGWTGSNGDTPQTTVTIETGSTENKTYAANYSLISYNIVYNLDGGNLATDNPTKYDVTSGTITLYNPTKDGCNFFGWTYEGQTTPQMTVSIDTGSTGDKSYTANWIESITFNLPNGVTLVMHKIPAGTFTMGCPATELGSQDGNGEKNQHQVTLTEDFYIGVYEVTQAQYSVVMGSNPSEFQSSNGYTDDNQRPVESVSWNDIKTASTGFIDKINTQLASQLPEGYKFDLPTEAQWEYACRADTITSLNNGTDLTSAYGICPNLDILAWYIGNSSVNDVKQTHPVDQKLPNAWGLYDMHGNVWEWCKDMYANYPTSAVTDPLCVSGSRRVIRGGSWKIDPNGNRSASRSYTNPSNASSEFGFRLALVHE